MTDILLLAHESDFALDRVISWLHQEAPRIDVVRINRERFEHLSDFSATLEHTGWQIDDLPRVVWIRQMLPERDPYGPVPSAKEIDDILVQRRQWIAWSQLLVSMGVRWLNCPTKAFVAESKIRQLAVATECGIAVPQTLLTNDRAHAESFTSRVGPCVVKSIATAYWEFSDQSFVFTTSAEDALSFPSSTWAAQPVFVQQQVPGTHDARVLVIGDRALGACRPRSSLDWRTDPAVPWTPWRPDSVTVDRCRCFLRRFSLEYGAFDFITHPDMSIEPVFLECNPAGEYGFLDGILDNQPSILIGQQLVEMTA